MSTGQFYHSIVLGTAHLSTPYRYLAGDAPGEQGLLRLTASMDPAGLNDLEEVALLNRLETKYVLREETLLNALSAIASRYRVLEICNIRLHRYVSLYFDTPDFFLYYRHHAGSKHRYKIRTREYTDSHLAFVEIKHKINQLRTIKNRLQTAEFLTSLPTEVNGFIQTNFPLAVDALEPKLLNAYRRITLVSKTNPERLTIDLNLRFYSDTGYEALPGIAIAEVKYQIANRHSDFMLQMREMGIRPMGFSKYCVGVSILYPQIKSNRFKPTLRTVRELMKGG